MREPCCSTWAMTELTIALNLAPIELGMAKHDPTCHVAEIAALQADQRVLLDLLAVIHRDGGHYTGEHGLEKSAQDARARVYADRAEVERLASNPAWAEVDGLRQSVEWLEHERDKAEAVVRAAEACHGRCDGVTCAVCKAIAAFRERT